MSRAQAGNLCYTRDALQDGKALGKRWIGGDAGLDFCFDRGDLRLDLPLPVLVLPL